MWKYFITDMEAFVDLLGGTRHHCAIDLNDECHGTGKDACSVFLRSGPVEGVLWVVRYEVDGIVRSC